MLPLLFHPISRDLFIKIFPSLHTAVLKRSMLTDYRRCPKNSYSFSCGKSSTVIFVPSTLHKYIQASIVSLQLYFPTMPQILATGDILSSVFNFRVYCTSKDFKTRPKDTAETHSGHSQTWPWSKRTQSDVHVLPKGISTLGATEQSDAVSEGLFRNRHFLSAFWKASLLFWLTGKGICNYMCKIWGSKLGFKSGVT